MDFITKLDKSIERNNSLLCVGLDPDPSKFPAAIGDDPEKILDFNQAIIDATGDIASCFKLNSAFYEPYGPSSIEQMKRTINYIQEKLPDMPIILDAKRGDIGNTNEKYAAYAFDYAGADAVTIQPYLGTDAVASFFERPQRAVFVLAKTSNPDSSEFQAISTEGQPLYEKVIKNFLAKYPDNCFFVAGATYPEELARVRALVGNAPILVPGLGAQGGDASTMVPAGLNAAKAGLVINSSRAILYASNGDDFAEAARAAAIDTRDLINQFRAE